MRSRGKYTIIGLKIIYNIILLYLWPIGVMKQSVRFELPSTDNLANELSGPFVC